MIRGALAGAMLLLTTSVSMADAIITDALALYDSGNPVGRAFMQGMTQGVDWANTASTVKLYCPPPGIVLTVEQHVGMLKDMLARYPEFHDSPLGAAVVVMLQKNFPCRR
ncbi:hypothetical protein [Bradyrhizobium sp. CCGUVB23]|uniref:hypothetical protein n=1 Tax=Bradyrhizobium sp. CCGUVB23 TaxID=2949630 RepID=UPI0020B42613|nr:hypothetical protein [Bradyrhizobium sp. CCGUVB23]MCP3468023.1 hypothetical protein [Bradyrhizobium sp. CCGUVB23]